MCDFVVTEPFPRSRFFSRRNLWILIFILIPLIYVLNEMGPDETVQANSSALQATFDIRQVPVQRERLAGQTVWWVPLPGSGVVEIGVLEPRLPTARIPIPDTQDLATAARNNQFIAYLRSPVEAAALEVSLAFLTEWLPAPSAATQYVLVGDLNGTLAAEIAAVLTTSRGPAVPFVAQSRSAITELTSPPTGSQENLAFLMAAEWLRAQISNDSVSFIWDHRGPRSQVFINTSLSPTQRQVPSEEQFIALRNAFLAQANVSERSVQQISRYVMTMAAFNLSTDYMATQAARTQQLDYVTFARVWRETIGGR